MRLVLLLALMLSLMCAGAGRADAQAGGRWLRAESPRFIVFSEGDERKLREAIEQLEIFDRLLRRLMRTGDTLAGAKLEIYLFRNHDGLEQVWPGVSEEIAGFYSPNIECVAAFAVIGRDATFAGQDILFHEYAHHFMAQNASMAFPAWFVEGYAEYVATADVRYDRVVVGDFAPGRAFSLIQGGAWLPIEQFLAPDRQAMSADATARFYAQSWLAAHYVFNTPERFEGMLRYFAALREGADPIAAFEPAVGVSPAAFQEELRAYVRGRLGRIAWRHGRVDPSEIVVTRMPASADDLLLLDVRLRRHVDDDERDALVAAARAAAARYPDDAFAARVRAGAALVAGEFAAARAIAEPLAAADANDWYAQFLLGASYLNEVDGPGDREALSAARRHFSRAFRVNPDHAPTLYYYARTFMYEPPPMNDGALDVLTKAYLLTPQVSDIGFNLATQLMLADRHQEAVGVLEPFVYSAHPNAGVDWARRMLEAARNNQPPPTWTPKSK